MEWMPYKKLQGVTLIETMLLLVVVSMMIYIGLQNTARRAEQNRINKTALQMQQILNAGLAYYVANGSWPAAPNISSLSSYLTPGMVSPWGGQPYYIASLPPEAPSTSTDNSLFYVYTGITSTSPGKAAALANTIAGFLPMAYTTQSVPTWNAVAPISTPCGTSTGTSTATTCYVVAAVNIPGKSMSNVRGVGWVGLIHHGGCVPVPACPVDQYGNTMTAQIMVVPVSVSGVNDPGTLNVYPLSSFTAFAVGPTLPGQQTDSSGYVTCPTFNGTHVNNDCPTDGLGYWRACAQVITEKGNVASTEDPSSTNLNYWGRFITLLAMTRCTTSTEPNGGGLTIYSN